MGALTDLGQLLRVAEQQQIARGGGHRDGVGEVELPGLFDDQQIEALPRDPSVIGEIPSGAADHAAAVRRDESRVVLLGDLGPRHPLAGLLLADAHRVGPGTHHTVEQVLDDGM